MQTSLLSCLNEKGLRDLAAEVWQYLLLALSVLKLSCSIDGNKIAGGFGLSSL